MLEIIAWTYEADYHCLDCAWKRFDHALEDPDTVDDEGNPLHPVFSWDEAPISGIVCSDCGEVIVPPVDAWVDAWEERGYITIQVFVGRNEFNRREVAYWEDDDAYRMIKDGFFKHHPIHGLDRESVIDYCREHGLLKWHGKEIPIATHTPGKVIEPS